MFNIILQNIVKIVLNNVFINPVRQYWQVSKLSSL